MKILVFLICFVLSSSLPLPGQTNRVESTGELPKAEAAVLQVERDWADAVKRRDTEKIDRIHAEEYLFTGPGGQVWTKARALESVKAGNLEIDSFEFSDVRVRLYGETAVITLQVVWNGRFRGMDITGPQRMTDVFVKRDGRWQCVASQATRITRP